MFVADVALTIAAARSAPAAYREHFLKLGWPQQYAHVRSLDLDGLKAHGEALGEAAPWSLGLRIADDLRPRSVECTIGYNTREHGYVGTDALASWLAAQLGDVARGGCRLVGCMIVMPHRVALDGASGLTELLGDTLPRLGWAPRSLWFNGVGYSDRGEPPEPSTSLRIAGEVRWPLAPQGARFESTVTMLEPTDVTAWQALLTTIARQLRLELRAV